MADKPQLHVSQMDMLFRCGIQFQRRYGFRFGVWHQEEKVAPGIALGVGSAVDDAVTKNMQHKMDTGKLAEKGAVLETARDTFDKIWSNGMLLTDDEADNTEGTRGAAIDTAVELADLHYEEVAPIIKPVAVQEAFVLELPGYPFDISGKKDLREEGTIRDTKTKAQTPPADAAKSMQMALYSISEKVIRGAYPNSVHLDFLVKTKTRKVELRSAVPTDDWIKPTLARVESAIKIIEAVKAGHQAFSPSPPDHWVCTKKFCGYATTCPFWSGR